MSPRIAARSTADAAFITTFPTFLIPSGGVLQGFCLKNRRVCSVHGSVVSAIGMNVAITMTAPHSDSGHDGLYWRVPHDRCHSLHPQHGADVGQDVNSNCPSVDDDYGPVAMASAIVVATAVATTIMAMPAMARSYTLLSGYAVSALSMNHVMNCFKPFFSTTSAETRWRMPYRE
jgi:hypothetical protein